MCTCCFPQSSSYGKERMRNSNDKRVYQPPRVVSEKVFEQAALACNRLRLGPPAGLPNFDIKTNVTICGYASS